MTVAYIGLGSNLDRPQQQLHRALEALASLPGSRLVGSSRFYRSAPVGDPDQPEFVNAVAGIDTALDAEALLDAIQAIERDHGRVRDPARRWGPRTLDLDLLLFGDQRIASARLTVPHPRMHQRAFVLCPLAELAPSLTIPGRGPVAQLLARVDPGGVRPLAD